MEILVNNKLTRQRSGGNFNMSKSMVVGGLFLSGLLLFSGSGCSISYSVDQSSDSVSQSLDSISAIFDSFTSVSTSSGSEKKDVQAALQRFRDDVKGLTRIFIDDTHDSDNFERQLADVAMQYGILDWEHEPTTFEAIGISLRQNGVAETDIAHVSFLQTPVLKQNRNRILEAFRQV